MQNFIISLNTHEILKVSGKESEKFLQGQLTCDLDNLQDGHCILGAACNNKGRVYSSFRLLRLAQDYFLCMHPGILDSTMTTLQKYIPFYKAEMTASRDSYNRIGLAGEEAEQLLKNHFSSVPSVNEAAVNDGNIILNISAENPRYECWLGVETRHPLLAELGKLSDDSNNWQMLDQAAGIFLVQKEDIGSFTPEELNMDLAGFISFDKGCYTGQEIVARMHYRGKAGKRLFTINGETSSPILDRNLKNTSGKKLGLISNILFLNDNMFTAFAVLKAETVPDESLWLESENGKIPVITGTLNY